MTDLRKVRSVLGLQAVRKNSVRFGYEDHQEGLRDLWLERMDWEGFGRPPEITITIEAGDRLNEEASDAVVAEAEDRDLPEREAKERRVGGEEPDAQARLRDFEGDFEGVDGQEEEEVT